MKTVMQELLQFVKYKINNDPATEYGRVYSEVFRQVRREIEDKYLEAEKEQIMEAYTKGVKDFARWEPERHGNKHPTAEDYYQQTYNPEQ